MTVTLAATNVAVDGEGEVWGRALTWLVDDCATAWMIGRDEDPSGVTTVRGVGPDELRRAFATVLSQPPEPRS